LKICVLTLSKTIHLGGTINKHYIHTHETMYLEKVRERFRKVTIADICYGGCYGCEGGRGQPRGLPHDRAREKAFVLL